MRHHSGQLPVRYGVGRPDNRIAITGRTRTTTRPGRPKCHKVS